MLSDCDRRQKKLPSPLGEGNTPIRAWLLDRPIPVMHLWKRNADAAAADHAARVARALRAAKLDARLKRKALATPKIIRITDPPLEWRKFNTRWSNFEFFDTWKEWFEHIVDEYKPDRIKYRESKLKKLGI